MTTVSQNLAAIKTAVVRFNAATVEARNDVLINYWTGMKREVRNNLTYTHGPRVYREKTLNQFLDLINDKPVWLPVQFLGGDDSEVLADAANWVYNTAYNAMALIKDTGAHQHSLTMFVREIGTQVLGYAGERVSASQMPERAEVSVVALIEYASTLEYLGALQGFLYYTALQARRRYGPEMVVKYDYVSGKKFGGKGGTFPRIRIAYKGNLRRATLKKPGQTAKRVPQYGNI